MGYRFQKLSWKQDWRAWWCEQSPEPYRSFKAAQKKHLVLPQIFLAVAGSCLARLSGARSGESLGLTEPQLKTPQA